MQGTLQLTRLGWFVTSTETPFGYPLHYPDLLTLSLDSNIKLDDRHGQMVDFITVCIPSFITTESITYASITKLHDDTIKFPLLTRLKNHLDSITPEEFDKSIDEFIEKYPSGPTMEEFICEMEDCPHCAYERQQEYEAELEKEACIDFAKWLAQSDWMSIWVTDKWMWECQLEDVHSGCVGYKTEEELYQIYLNEN